MKSRRFPYARQDSSLSSSNCLSVARDVEVRDGNYSALSEVPWLRIEFNGPPPAGRWIKLTYVASLFDQLARPVIRCFIGGRHHDEILPGALFGRAVWFGYIPEGTEEIWISPTNRLGSFGFSIESLATLSSAELIWRCLRQNPRRCITGLAAHLVGLRYAANTQFRRVLLATRLEDYDAWRKLRHRDLDLTNLERPRANWESGPRIRFVTTLQSSDPAVLQSLVSQLLAQPYPHWTLAVVSPLKIDQLLGLAPAALSAHVIRVEPSAMACEALKGLSDDDFVLPIAIGDRIPAYAVAVLAEAATENPVTDIFYGDQEFIDSSGHYTTLALRPDWSPAFCAASAYMDGAEFFRVKLVKQFAGDMTAVDLMRTPDIVAKSVVHQDLSVSHIRRVMRTRSGVPPSRGIARPAPNAKNGRLSVESTASPCATIIIPTQDRLELLECCIGSLKKKTLSHDIEVIIIDNNSIQEKTRQFFEELVRDVRFRVISHPGPFNFSRLCNDAASEARASTLVFLNNDTEFVDEHWLEPLLYWSRQSDVGAVGAKLLYPNGRVQHAGVVLGIDGRAAHFERMLESDNPGYFGRLCFAHEVSAVTAACLAVDKRKFDAVGGFDAVNLAVELNDIDLCLRLSEQGWKSICASESVLIHHESASRGTTLRPDKIYRKEHHHFRVRWMHRLRDDPYFHPALSLDRLDAALG